MKKIIFSLALFVGSSVNAFSDVSTMDPQLEAITYMKTNNIVQGYEDGSFKPMNKINRAEFTKIIIGAEYSRDLLSNCEMEVPFSDVNTTDWFYPYVCTAKAQGIIEGYSDGTFGPTKEISFPEAAKITLETLKKNVSSDPIWYKPYVEKLADLKAIPTDVLTIDQSITRGQMAEILFRIKTQANKESKTYDSFFKTAETQNADTKSQTETVNESGSYLSRSKGSVFDREAFLAESKARDAAKKAESEANLKAKKEAEAALIAKEMQDRDEQNLRAMFDISFHKSVIIKNCEDKWEDDQSMVKFCIESELESIEDIQRNDHEGLSQEEDMTIFLNCYDKWENDYGMIEYCLDNQQEALRDVKAIKNDALKEKCEDKWGDDYEMVLYCYEE